MGRSSLAALALALAACLATPSGDVNLPKLQAYVVAVQDTLQGFVVANSVTDPEYAAELQKVTDAIQLVRVRVDQAVAGGVDTIDVVQALDLALVATAALSEATIEDPVKRAKVVSLATAIAAALRLARIELVE